mmetsp:Transcript_8328/g.7902  ORF Transcript_8328/g.7902 Transcript_8328/m.7902 type:complete len:86 (+) Transcript_8328:520-777(+)
MPKLKKGHSSDKAGKTAKTKEIAKTKLTKSPYEIGVKRMVTPMSQKRKRSGYQSNPRQVKQTGDSAMGTSVRREQAEANTITGSL